MAKLETGAPRSPRLESFTPTTISIHVGQTMECNSFLITHSVTDDAKLAKSPGDAALAAGAAAVDSGDVPAGDIFTYTFTTSGTCMSLWAFHEGAGMLGTIVVAPGS